jgi:hypothetical protein
MAIGIPMEQSKQIIALQRYKAGISRKVKDLLPTYASIKAQLKYKF